MKFKIMSIASYVISTVFMGTGFYKMLVYESSESYFATPKNAYVGGDAYNFIINSNFTIAFFVLATLFVILGSTFMIVGVLEGEKLNNANTRNSSK